jgi:hypothetical protein
MITNNTGGYSPSTGGTFATTTTGTYTVPFPLSSNHTEFGKSFEVSLNALQDDSMIAMTYDMVLKDYFKVKNENFPNWCELPDIRVRSNGLSSKTITWYLAVPNDQIVDPIIKEEEDLWKS